MTIQALVRLYPLLGVICAASAFGLTGCGSSPVTSPPFVPGDSGIPDRVIWDGGSGDRDGGDASADASADVGSDGGDAGAVTDADANADAPRARLSVAIDLPADDAVVPTKDRFVPAVTAVLELPAGSVPDELDEVTAEIWSADGVPAKLSGTALGLTSRLGAEGDASASYLYTDTPVNLGTLASGRYELRVAATTLGGLTARATRRFRADAGPVIRITRPVEGASYRESLIVQVAIDDPLFPPIQNVAMTLGVNALVVSGPTGTPARDYTTTIDFTRTTPPLDGEQLLQVRAANGNGTVATAAVRFVVDNRGPTLADTKPVAGELVGAIVDIEATVADPAGVLETSVVAVVAHGSDSFTVRLGADPNLPGHFVHRFDTRVLSPHAIYPTISFRASDLLGNESAIGYAVALDNTPPLADLDPPAGMRLMTRGRCSQPFDPVGDDAAGDGELVTQLFDLRARVEDRGNSPAFGPQDIVPISLVDPDRVELVVLDDTSQPLVVDTDGDGRCDQLNPLLAPTTVPVSSQQVLLINLVNVPPNGRADFTVKLTAPPYPLVCLPGDAPSVPDVLCHTTDMTHALGYSSSNAGAIWTLPPVIAQKPECVGIQFDALANHISNGWACVALRTADELGNVQVSRPIRVCIDKDGSGGGCPQQQLDAVQIDENGRPVLVARAPHGLATGDEVAVTRTYAPLAMWNLNGAHRITVVDAHRFTLDDGPVGVPTVGWMPGRFVKTSELPDCTGTQTSMDPVAVTSSPACTPWAWYPRDEIRVTE